MDPWEQPCDAFLSSAGLSWRHKGKTQPMTERPG